MSSKTDISIGDVKREMSSSSIGRETLKQIEKSDVTIQMIQGVIPSAGIRGEQEGKHIRLYLDNMPNSVVAAQTVIHEMAHYYYDIGNCQWAEAVCFSMEKMHIENKTSLTIAELRQIVKLAKDNYKDLKWKKGGYRNGRTFK